MSACGQGRQDRLQVLFRAAHYASIARAAGRTELALAGYFGALAAFAWMARFYRALPFLALLVVGLGWVGWSSRVAGRPGSRAERAATAG